MTRPGRQHLAGLVVQSARVSGFMAGLAWLVLMFLTVVDVGGRSLLGAGLNTVALVTLVMVGAGYLGLGLAEVNNAHVRTPILTSRMGRRTGSACRLVGVLAAAGFMAATCYLTWGRAMRSLDSGEVTTGLESLPVWPSRLAIPVGLALLLFASLRQVPRLVRGVLGHQVPAESEPPSWQSAVS